MKRLIGAAALAVVLGLVPNPRPADAATRTVGCLEEAIASCDADFAGDRPETIGIRGWCYMIRMAMCRLL